MNRLPNTDSGSALRRQAKSKRRLQKICLAAAELAGPLAYMFLLQLSAGLGTLAIASMHPEPGTPMVCFWACAACAFALALKSAFQKGQKALLKQSEKAESDAGACEAKLKSLACAQELIAALPPQNEPDAQSKAPRL